MSRRGDRIRKRKDGRWEGRIPIETINGKKYKSIYAASYTEVKNKMALFMIPIDEESESENGNHQIYSMTTNASYYSTVIDDILNNIRKENKYSTYIKYKSIYKKYIISALPMEDDSTTREFLPINIENKEMISSSIKRSIQTAVNKINENVADNAVFPQLLLSLPGTYKNKEDIIVFSQKEQAQLIHYLYKDMDINKFGILLCLSTGMRLGELCALKWEDFNFEQGYLAIQRTVQRVAIDGMDSKTVLMISAPKSICSCRKIPLSDEMIKISLSFYKNVSGYIFNITKPLEPRTYQNRFKKMLRDASIEPKNFHILRHTFATNCVGNGIDIKTLSEILGHSDVKITMNRYVHPTMDTKRQHMNCLSDVYGQYLGQ